MLLQEFVDKAVRGHLYLPMLVGLTRGNESITWLAITLPRTYQHQPRERHTWQRYAVLVSVDELDSFDYTEEGLAEAIEHATSLGPGADLLYMEELPQHLQRFQGLN